MLLFLTTIVNVLGPKEVIEEDEFHDIPDDRSVITSTKQTEVL